MAKESNAIVLEDIKKQKAAIKELNVGDTYTNGHMVVRVDNFFMDIVYVSVFEAEPPYANVKMVAKEASQIIAELNAANATKWTPPEGYKVAMPFEIMAFQSFEK